MNNLLSESQFLALRTTGPDESALLHHLDSGHILDDERRLHQHWQPELQKAGLADYYAGTAYKALWGIVGGAIIANGYEGVDYMGAAIDRARASKAPLVALNSFQLLTYTVMLAAQQQELATVRQLTADRFGIALSTSCTPSHPEQVFTRTQSRPSAQELALLHLCYGQLNPAGPRTAVAQRLVDAIETYLPVGATAIDSRLHQAINDNLTLTTLPQQVRESAAWIPASAPIIAIPDHQWRTALPLAVGSAFAHTIDELSQTVINAHGGKILSRTITGIRQPQGSDQDIPRLSPQFLPQVAEATAKLVVDWSIASGGELVCADPAALAAYYLKNMETEIALGLHQIP